MVANVSKRFVRGFVLPMTLVLLALMSIGVALMAHRSDQLRQLVAASIQDQVAAVEVQSALAQAQFLTTTLRRRGSRLGNIALDGRYYRAVDGAYVSFQDAGGLFNLQRASAREIAGLLRALGVGDDKATMLADTLLDYVDADYLVRLNGAEAADYVAAKLPPPRNAPLLTATELSRIVGWRDLDPATMRSVLDNVYVGATNLVNRYTVKSPVLAAISGAEPQVVQDLLALRGPDEPAAIESLPSAPGHNNLLVSGRIVVMPLTTTIVTICPPLVAWCQRVGLTTIASAFQAPWHVDFAVRQMRQEPLPAPDRVPALADQPPMLPPPPLMTPFGPVQ